jgi:tetratricopeptide (TPR) repeat protein
MIGSGAALVIAFASCLAVRAAPPATQAQSFEQIARAAERARDESRDDEAIRLFQDGLKLKADWNEGLWYLGTMLYEKERFGEARDLLRSFIALNPKFGPGWAVLGMSEFQTRDYARALEHLRLSMSLGVGDRKQLADSVFFHVALLLTRFEQYHDSLELLWQMRGAGQAQALLEVPAGLAALGYALLPQEVPSPRRELARLAGAGIFALLDQRRADAEKLFRQMADEYPQEPGVHYQYGALLLDDRPADGIQELRRELQISPSHIPARLRLAEYYVTQSEPDHARPVLDDVIKLDPKNASAHMLLGELLAASGDTAGAIRTLELARDQAPQRARIRWALLRAYTAAGRREEANREKAVIEKLSQQQSGKP